MKNSGINWTDHTANFWWGCGPPSTTDREYKVGIWREILKWDAEAKTEGIRRRVFVSSMSDFLEDHPQVKEWREEAMNIIERLESLDVLILTKRPENAFLLGDWNTYGLPPHVWMGTSVEHQKAFNERVPHLLNIPARVRFLSVEPQLEMIHLPHNGDILWAGELHWIICGGESGAKSRPFEWDWARQLRDDCKAGGIAFWMKQGGGHPNKREKLEDIPEDLRIRELPEGADHANLSLC